MKLFSNYCLNQFILFKMGKIKKMNWFSSLFFQMMFKLDVICKQMQEYKEQKFYTRWMYHVLNYFNIYFKSRLLSLSDTLNELDNLDEKDIAEYLIF
jgi:hypothetical protein